MPAGVIGPRGRITEILVTSYTLSDQDNRNTLVFNNSGAITVTIPLSLQIGWTVNIIQQGAGAITLSPITGVTLNNLNSATGISGQYAAGVLTAVRQNVFDLSIITTTSAATIPTADIIGGNGSAFTSVTVGDGLDFTTGTLSNPIPTADLLGGDGTDYTSVTVGAGLTLNAGALTAAIPTVRNVSAGTTDTILITDHGNAVSYHSSDGSVTVTVPAGLGAGFTCLLLQVGADAFTVTGSGATVLNRQTQLSSAGQGAVCSLFADAANHLLFAGDTA